MADSPLGTPLESSDPSLAQATAQEPQGAVEAANQLSQTLESQEQLEAERAGIGMILASFSARPARSLLSPPIKVVSPPAPPVRDWIQTPRPNIPAAAPTDRSIVSFTEGPQLPTLNGPSLPPELRGHADAAPSQPEPSRKSSGPPWMVSFLIATGLVLGSVSVMQYVTARRDVQAPPASAKADQASAGDRVLEEHPFARFVEVSGVRITSGQTTSPNCNTSW